MILGIQGWKLWILLLICFIILIGSAASPFISLPSSNSRIEISAPGLTMKVDSSNHNINVIKTLRADKATISGAKNIEYELSNNGTWTSTGEEQWPRMLIEAAVVITEANLKGPGTIEVNTVDKGTSLSFKLYSDSSTEMFMTVQDTTTVKLEGYRSTEKKDKSEFKISKSGVLKCSNTDGDIQIHLQNPEEDPAWSAIGDIVGISFSNSKDSIGLGKVDTGIVRFIPYGEAGKVIIVAGSVVDLILSKTARIEEIRFLSGAKSLTVILEGEVKKLYIDGNNKIPTIYDWFLLSQIRKMVVVLAAIFSAAVVILEILYRAIRIIKSFL